MNQKVPVLFVLILAVAFAALLYFYFNATLDRYSIRVKNEVYEQLLDVYQDVLIERDTFPSSYYLLKEKYGEFQALDPHFEAIENYYQNTNSDQN